MRVTLWKANDDHENGIEDTNMSEEKIFSEEYIRIKNNIVEISEGLKDNKSISISTFGDLITIDITNFEHSFKIPEEVDVNDELVVNVSAKSDPDYERIVKEELQKSQDQSTFSVSPNPASEILTISSFDTDESVEINLFDSSGKLIRNLYQGNLLEQRGDMIFYIEDLADGIYLLTIVGESIYETRKIVISR